MRQLITTDGTIVEILRPLSVQEVGAKIGAQIFDTVILRHMGEPMHVMIVDDTGMVDGRPVNPKATELYWKNCKPGAVHAIHGDVVVCPDGDFA